jgi:hypothetical protein
VQVHGVRELLEDVVTLLVGVDEVETLDRLVPRSRDRVGLSEQDQEPGSQITSPTPSGEKAASFVLLPPDSSTTQRPSLAPKTILAPFDLGPLPSSYQDSGGMKNVISVGCVTMSAPPPPETGIFLIAVPLPSSRCSDTKMSFAPGDQLTPYGNRSFAAR